MINVLGVGHHYELTPSSSESEVTLVFVHGWMLSREYWLPLIQQLSTQYHCLSYDLRGFGRSATLPDSDPKADLSFGLERTIVAYQSQLDASPGSPESSRPTPIKELFAQRCQASYYSPAAYARDLLILLDKLDIKAPVLVGHSLGGTIALWAAAAMSDRIQGLVCLNSGGGIYIKESFDKFRAAGRRLAYVRPSWLVHVPGLDWCFSRVNVAKPVARTWGQQQIQDFVSANAEAVERSLLDSTDSKEVLLLPQLVQGLQLPIHFIAGENDKVMELKYIYHLASFHPGFETGKSTVLELPQCGHLGMIEQPTAIANHLRTLLSQKLVASTPSR